MNQPALNAADDAARARRRPSAGYWLMSALLAFVVFELVWFAVRTPGFGWPQVLKYITAPTVLQGLSVSLALTGAGMTLGITLGIGAALLKIGPFLPGRWLASFYVWLFRGTPLLIQLIFWYNLAYLLPRIEIGLPFGLGPVWASMDTNALITPVTAALLGLALNEGAYMTEIIRAGLLSVDSGQRDAARAIGMRPVQIFWRVVLPQAMRFIVPPTGSQVIGMLKGTSLVSVIAMADLLFSVQAIYARTFDVIPLLIVGVIWYLLAFSVLYVLLGWLERRYSRGHRAAVVSS